MKSEINLTAVFELLLGLADGTLEGLPLVATGDDLVERNPTKIVVLADDVAALYEHEPVVEHGVLGHRANHH